MPRPAPLPISGQGTSLEDRGVAVRGETQWILGVSELLWIFGVEGRLFCKAFDWRAPFVHVYILHLV